MSRHRFVRNMDLEAELADDQGGDYYEDDGYVEGGFDGSGDEEPDDGMTDTERAQMASALPVARAQLKDIKPPISDAAIQDSLWHYWFDVEKTVSWIRKDWEKKGESAPPAELVPTPGQKPRPRRSKPRRRAAPQAPTPNGPKPAPPPAAQAAPAAPLTALQRLRLARQQQQQGSTTPATTSTVSTPAGPSVPSTPSPAPSPGPASSGKPLSKLALFAQKRREGAGPKDATGPSPSSQPLTAGRPVAVPSSLPSSGLSTPPAASDAPKPELDAPAPVKPLSKLQQKMAAQRAARTASQPDSRSTSPGKAIPTPSSSPEAPPAKLEDEVWGLFPSPSPPSSNQPTTAPSSFFSILTTNAPEASPPEPPSLANMHIAVRGDPVDVVRRVHDAFGPGVESPDDIVLRMRNGRAGTGDAAPSGEPKASKVEVRAAKADDAVPDAATEPSAATSSGKTGGSKAAPREEKRPSHATRRPQQIKAAGATRGQPTDKSSDPSTSGPTTTKGGRPAKGKRAPSPVKQSTGSKPTGTRTGGTRPPGTKTRRAADGQ